MWPRFTRCRSTVANCSHDVRWHSTSFTDQAPKAATDILSSGMPLMTSSVSSRAASRAAMASDLSLMGRIPPPVATRPAALPRRSDHDRLALLAEHAAQHVADLADGDVALHALDEHRHQVGFRPGRLVQPPQHLLRPPPVPLGADALQALHLAPDDLLAHPQDLGPRLLVGG